MLIFHRVQPNRKIQRRDAAAANIRLRFDAIALSCNAQGVGIDRKFIQLGGVAPALYPLGMDTLMLCPTLGGVRALRPKLFIRQQRGTPQAETGV